ncbi:MAG TPA: hypothetical protein PLP34_07200, partial [Chitinophagaceae bacterium]|nr:hypothetical protein [Chitinophagaceae bacterium]
KDAIPFLQRYVQKHHHELNRTTRHQLEALMGVHAEWAPDAETETRSRKPLLRSFYRYKSDFIHYSDQDFLFILNPILYYQQTKEKGNSTGSLFINTKGIELRGHILKRLGFYSRFCDNQERGPLHHQEYVLHHQAVPGAAFYKDFKNDIHAQDYITANGYLDASLLHEKVNVSFGHDQFHWGDGYRSLFLSDIGAPYLFLKLNTRLGKINYQNLYLSLTPQFQRGADRLLDKKFATLHHLSVQLNSWLQVGLYESVVYGRKNQFELQYLNPVILYRYVEQANGSPDNALMGLNFKVNTPIRMIAYGQFLLDEFSFSQMKKGKGWWGNKYGLQLGMKIADLFGVPNLYVQPELNVIRPFTYSFRDSVAEFSHYNQSLAHPYGANLFEGSIQIRYQPAPRIWLSFKGIYNRQGRDTASMVTFGGNIFSSYQNPHDEFGVYLFNGYVSEVMYANFNCAYEWKSRLYLDLGVRFRNETAYHPSNPTYSSSMWYAGLRLNTGRREYDY